MKIIKLSHPHHFTRDDFDEMTLALGYFDGVHKGHQRVILKAKEIASANGMKSAVMTFHPHPLVVLRKQKQLDSLTTLSEKIKLIEELGIDILFIVEFTNEFASLLPQQFVDDYIISFNVKHVVAGFDFTYGHLGKGTMETLPFHSRKEFLHTTVEKQTDDDKKISSSLIRNVIKTGEMEYAHKLLGRPYTVNGVVIHGDKRGRTIGFPTANIDVDDSILVPETGVYAVTFSLNEKEYKGVCNIGYKPTFEQEQKPKPSIEVNIFEFNDEIYGEKASISFYKRLRSEQKFSSIEALINQITKDKEEALKYFEKN
ncbi:bifunctional riboflavin kinase/FAD synthetase [Metabacillus malikii]|uniref:Riboflavin biosynthesis protein n=1 Tax=Metabacillus malikii TaxID=1504265 RepID=A0ABT9ZDY8_9BACI|nr:bifunctional riboflavin kinase/FAD synthetase [Metabacillus malikii]MDQ0230486.1 riboflavin kinase/FMN adenylyltransferase [Metabacillus malikii]